MADAIIEALEEALANNDIPLYNELKEEFWVVDFNDFEREKEEAIKW